MNKMIRLFIGLGSVFCLVVLGTGVLSRGYSDDLATKPFGTVYAMPAGWSTFQASWLVGLRVLTPTKAELGQIESLVIDRTNGRVAAVVLSDVPNFGARRLVLPFSSITDIGQATCMFDPGNMVIGPSLEPNYIRNSDPYIYALTVAGHPLVYDIPSSMDVVWLSDVYAMYGQAPYWEAEGQQVPTSLEFVDSSDLMGAQVQLASGEMSGRINDFVIDASDGRIAFLVLSDLPGRPETFVAVPFGTLTFHETSVYVLNVSGDQLASAKAFNDYSHLHDQRWAHNVYTHFGMQPYWTDHIEMSSSTDLDVDRNDIDLDDDVDVDIDVEVND